MAIGDMFLKIQTARQGLIKGESRDPKHEAEIDVVSWSWGMRAQTGMGGAGASSKRTLDELDIVKRMDSASTALMSVLCTNELIKSAVLTVRKAGTTPLEYVEISLGKARLTALTVEAVDTEIMERLSLAFKSIEVNYVPQGADGAARGGMTFSDEILG